ncbi:hypothetical protein LPJ66_002185 [Kickxella alabastrina]|uniref:Uncharacterized protein n=1 Tax=Kickxella alabastrina TaxID=61397 RepID=A0ACC1IR81_9FUNG|nr:hypothetical protein LPJ66_002185 [Kickxella alabastrina]
MYSVLDQNIPPGESRACAFDNKRVSPVSVAIARDASNVSRLTSHPCADIPANCNSSHQSDDPKMAAPPEHSPPPISTVSTSPGCTESFTTARLFSGTMSPEPLMPRHNLAEIFDGGHPDEVSDIAMRNHLADARDSNEETADTDDINIFTSDNETQSNYPSSDDNSIVDRAFHEWLQAQAAINDHPEAHSPFTTISQTASQLSATPPSRTMPTYVPGWAYMPPLYGGLSGSQQSHYSSSMMPAAANIPPPSFSRAVGSDQLGVLEDLISRVSDLESRFMCVEAIMGSFGDKLDVLMASARADDDHSMSIGNACAAGVLSSGKTPVVKRVKQQKKAQN